MVRRLAITLLMTVGIVFAGLSPSANAAFKIQASIDGGAFTTVFDGQLIGPVTDSSVTAGVINADFTAVLPGVTFTITIGSSKPAIGNALSSEMDISIDGGFTGGSHTLTIEVTDTGFGLAVPPPGTPSGAGTLTSELSAAGSGDITSMSFQSWLDNANAEFGIPGTAVTPLLTAIGVSSVDVTAVAPYSLTNRTVFTGTGSFSFDNITVFTPIPEPATMAIWSVIGGIGAVAGWRRRRKA